MLLALTTSTVDWAEAVSALSLAGVLALLVLLLIRGDLVTRRSHDALLDRCSEELGKVEEDRDEWKRVAMEALNVTEALAGRR